MKNSIQKKHVLIIGGGVSGLSTAIYLKRNGYQTTVLEKNANVGGACVGWERQGCYIDGSIHWLVGTNPNSTTYRLWEEIGALSKDVEIFSQNDFYTLDFADGKKFTVWADIEKLKKELLDFAPEDTKQIKKFYALVKRFQKIDAPVEKPVDLMNLFELLKIGLTMCGDYYYVNKTSKISCEEYAQRFKNPYIRRWLSEHMSSGYNLMSFLYMYAHVTANNGGIPLGGSQAFSERMKDTYLSLGGNLRLGAEAEKILIEQDAVKGVQLKNGEILSADWVVASTPCEHTLKQLLGGNYPLKKIDERLSDEKTYPVYTYTTAAFKIAGDLSAAPLSHKIHTNDAILLNEPHFSAVYRNYSYDKTLKIAPGHTLVQATLAGDDTQYFWWKAIKDKGAAAYRAKKQEIAERLKTLFLTRYTHLAGKIECIDVLTPLTYERYLNGRHGSFQGFVQTSKGKSLMQKGEIKGLKNFILSGQWILRSGGLPPAAITGKFAAQRICKKDKVKFKTL